MDVKDLLRSATVAAQQIERERNQHSILCRIGWHAWSRWHEISRGKRTDAGRVIGFFSHHRRCCLRCNKPEEKLIELY